VPTIFHYEEKEQKHCHHILLVDDEEDILCTFKKGIASEGYAVESFADWKPRRTLAV
jgi:DNA-binding response OmpR family regulator